MKHWENIISWFEFAKQQSNCALQDNFRVVRNDISVEGEFLCEWVDEFWCNESVDPEQSIVDQFDLSDMDNRMRLKSFLVKFISEVKRISEQEAGDVR